jgi:hypothetical protein
MGHAKNRRTRFVAHLSIASFLLRRTSLAQIVSARQSYLPAAGVIRAAAGGPVGTGRRQDVVGMLDKAPVVPHNGLEDSGLEDSETQQER